MPTRAPQPAGDVDGDGVNDWMYRYPRAPDERTDDLSDQTTKTFLKFGGAFGDGYYDALYYAGLRPVGDVNDDDRADAVQFDGGDVLLWLGSEEGYVAAGVRIERLEAGDFLIGSSDFDEDGYDDVAVGSREAGSDVQVDVIYGAAEASDVVLQAYDWPLDADEREIFEVNSFAEGEPARIVHVREGSSGGTDLQILAFDSDRAISVEQTLSSTEIDNPEAVFLYDGTGDGRREIVVKDWSGDVYAFLSTGDGTIEADPIQIHNPSLYGSDIEPIGDLDGDGTYDYFEHRHDSNNTQGQYRILFAAGDFTDGLYGDYATLPFADGERGQVSAPYPFFGDLDGDDKDDYLLTVNGFDHVGPRFITSEDDRTVSMQDNPFEQADFTYEEVHEAVNIGDWNGDGTDDVALLVRRGDAKRRLRGRIEFFFDAVQDAPDHVIEAPDNMEPIAAAAGELTGNGARNLAVAWKVAASPGYSTPPPPPPSPAVSIYEQGTSGPVHTIELEDFDPDLTYPLPGTLGITELASAGDANDDGIEDLLLGAPHAQVSGYAGKNPFAFLYFGGAALPTEADVKLDYSDLPFGEPGAGLAGLGDINGDGIEDFAVRDEQYQAPDGTFSATYVHFGRDEGSPSSQFASPDLVLAVEGSDYEWLNGFNVTSGDFDGDGFADLVTPALLDGIPNLAFFWGGPDLDADVDAFVEIPTAPLAVDPSDVEANAWQLTWGELSAVPDLNEDGADELLLGTADMSFTNALLFVGESLTPEAVFVASNQARGLGSDGSATQPWGQSYSAIGDFDGDEVLDFVMPQRQDPNFLGSPAYTYSATSEHLPVELATFTATVDGDRVRLDWYTASEASNAGFEVQRRLKEDGGAWTTIGHLEGAGTTTRPQNYRFVDEHLPFTATTAAYRLRQIDADGAGTLSDIVTVQRGAPDAVELHGTFPNPARHAATVHYELPEGGPVRLEVYNLLGQHIATLVDDEQAAGRKEHTVDVRRWASGAYFLRLTTEGAARTQRLVVLR